MGCMAELRCNLGQLHYCSCENIEEIILNEHDKAIDAVARQALREQGTNVERSGEHVSSIPQDDARH